jgi:hypothetical protein
MQCWGSWRWRDSSRNTLAAIVFFYDKFLCLTIKSWYVQKFHRANSKEDEPAYYRGATWQVFEGMHTLSSSKSGLTTFSCLVSSPKIVTRYLLSTLICQVHLSRNLCVCRFDFYWSIVIRPAFSDIRVGWEETETLLEGNLICKEYFYIIRPWQGWMAEVSFYTCLISVHDHHSDTLKPANNGI